MAGLLSDSHLRHRLDIDIQKCEWDPSLDPGERCGVLFQQTTLLDALTVAGNVCVALEACSTRRHKKGTVHGSREELNRTIKDIIEMVGLDYARDGPKRVSQLSGGMARRASLALQLAQRKHVIVLDEPFTGLDRDAAVSVAKELVSLRKRTGTALLLISHEPDLAEIVMTEGEGGGTNQVIELKPPVFDQNGATSSRVVGKPNLYGRAMMDRFSEKLLDYFVWSLPLIVLTFISCGLAIAMLSADILRKVNVTEPVLGVISKEVPPMIKMLTGDDPNAMTMMMINLKIRGMLNNVIPSAKATFYALGMAKLFVLEIGPLMTALLLAGRVGGSYAGEVGTMQATSQNKLLLTLGISPRIWTLVPAMLASLVASPLLTGIGTTLAIYLGSWVGPSYGIGSFEQYMQDIRRAVFPGLRLRSIVEWTEETSMKDFIRNLDLRCTHGSSTLWETFVEILTYPPIFLLTKACVFMITIILVAETSARWKRDLTPRDVPKVITHSVVLGSLLIIMMDWGFSQLLLKRKY
jgi:ABC-type transporter Mla maintaining outer membrane lipid asymmetry permease subunit MlaE/ABC-type uncharacterized transport system YnjBCD ATPase subunit